MKLPFIRYAVTVTRAKRMEYFINLTLMHASTHACSVCLHMSCTCILYGHIFSPEFLDRCSLCGILTPCSSSGCSVLQFQTKWVVACTPGPVELDIIPLKGFKASHCKCSDFFLACELHKYK